MERLSAAAAPELGATQRRRPGRSLLPAGLSRGDQSPDFPLVSSRSSFLPASPAPLLAVGDGEGPARSRLCSLVLDRVFVPAAPRPLRTGGRRGRRRPRSHGAGEERSGAGADAAGAGPGALSCPAWFPCAWRRGSRSPRSVGRYSSSAVHVRRSRVCLWRTRLRAEQWAAGAQGGGGGRDRGGGGGGEPSLPTAQRPGSYRRASASLPPGTLPGETGASPGSRKSR